MINKSKQKLISTKHSLTINSKKICVTNCVGPRIPICTTTKKRFIKKIEERKNGGMVWMEDERYGG